MRANVAITLTICLVKSDADRDTSRGFAVVGADVRMLAQRAGAAAKEIRALVESSAGNVQAGGRLVSKQVSVFGL